MPLTLCVENYANICIATGKNEQIMSINKTKSSSLLTQGVRYFTIFFILTPPSKDCLLAFYCVPLEER